MTIVKHGKVAYFPFTMNLKGTNWILIENDEDGSLNEIRIMEYCHKIRNRYLKKTNLE